METSANGSNTVLSCLTCGKTLRGRSEKKFCNLNCKNQYNNELKAQENAEIGRIRGILLKNRRILKALAGGKLARRVSGKALRENGFLFHYYTHHYQTKDGKRYAICFDYGYLEVEADWFVVVKREEGGDMGRA